MRWHFSIRRDRRLLTEWLHKLITSVSTIGEALRDYCLTVAHHMHMHVICICICICTCICVCICICIYICICKCKCICICICICIRIWYAYAYGPWMYCLSKFISIWAKFPARVNTYRLLLEHLLKLLVAIFSSASYY